MAAAYIDEAYIASFIGLDVLQALFTTPTVTYAGGGSAQLTTVIEAVSEDIKTAALHAGYTLGDTTSSSIVKKATLAAFLQTVNTRKGISVGKDLIAMWGGYITAIENGDIPLGSPSEVGGRGGVSVSDTSEGGDYEPVFGGGPRGSKLSGY